MNLNRVLKSIVILATGTASAQLINFIFIPIITRLYGPEAYGVMGSFMALVNILIPIASLSYPIAIVLTKSDKTAIHVAFISMGVGVCAAAFSLVTVIVTYSFSLQFSSLPTWCLLFVPFIVLFLPLQQIGQQWLIRKKEYKEIAKISIVQALTINSIKIFGGFLYSSQIMLVASTAFGVLFQSLQYYYRSYKTGLRIPTNQLKKPLIKKLISYYYDFPVFRTPQVLVNAFSQNLPIILLGHYFDARIVGFVVLAQTLLTAPVTLLSTSISNVYYPAVVERFSKQITVFAFLGKAILGLFLLGICIYVPVIVLSGNLFKWFFGMAWQQTGDFAQWMALYSIFWLAARPAMDTIPSLKIQNYFLLYEIISFVLRITSIFLGYYFYKDAIHCMMLFSLTNALCYASLSLFVLYKAYRHDCNAKTRI